MVKSGLVNDPTVSQYRLAVHLSNALLILFLLIWTLLEFKNGHSKIKLDFSFIIFCFYLQQLSLVHLLLEWTLA